MLFLKFKYYIFTLELTIGTLYIRIGHAKAELILKTNRGRFYVDR